MLGNNSFVKRCNYALTWSEYQNTSLYDMAFSGIEGMHELYNKFGTQCNERVILKSNEGKIMNF